MTSVADVLGRDGAGGEHVGGVQRLLELVVVTFDTDREAHVAAGKIEQRAVGLQRQVTCLARGVRVAIGDDQVDQRRIVRDVEACRHRTD